MCSGVWSHRRPVGSAWLILLYQTAHFITIQDEAGGGKQRDVRAWESNRQATGMASLYRRKLSWPASHAGAVAFAFRGLKIRWESLSLPVSGACALHPPC
jgi:hypothetical protein